MRRHAALVTIGLLLSGCAAVGPDYRLPDRAVVKRPEAQAAFVDVDTATVDTSHAAADAWWKLYDDPTLDALETQAFKANAALREAEAHLRQAYAMLDAARAEGGLTGGASASASRNQLSAESYLQSDKLPVFTLSSVAASASYEFDLFGKLRRATEASAADAEATRAARDLVRTTVAAEVARSYLGQCEATHDLSVAQETLRIQEQVLSTTTRMMAAGRGTRIDVTRATTQRDLARAELPPIEKRRDASRYALAALTGETPGRLPSAVEACDEAPHLSTPIPVGDGATLLRRRPDVRQAERHLAAATARIGVATAELYPDITLGAGLGSNGTLADVGQAPARYWSLGPLISWTVPTRSSHARVRASEAGADTELAAFDQTVLTALKEAQTTLSDYARALDRQALLKQALNDATQASSDAQTLFRAGRSPYLSSLDAERTRVSTEHALADADREVTEAQVNLFFALGGGWQTQDP